MTTERMTDEHIVATIKNMANDADGLVVFLAKESSRARSVEQEQAAESALLKQSQAAQKYIIEGLREQIARLTQERAEWQDATGCTSPRQADEHVKALHSKADTANECARLANDKMDAQVRQARWNVACEAIARGRGADEYLWQVRDANVPKD